jgi:hypothetical protein
MANASEVIVPNIKMVLYGEPGVGKSTFAAGAPNPFFITTDGNYEYLVAFSGAKPDGYRQVYSWEEATQVFSDTNLKKYDTIVIDLLEDMYLWCESEFCIKNKIQHVTDFGYGKGWAMVRQEFFLNIAKVLAMPKNVILIMHGNAVTLKDRRGVEYTKYGPVNTIPDKVLTQIEGRVRYFVRAYATAEENADKRFITKRWISLNPDGQTEYGITRGLSPDAPREVPLDWNAFCAAVAIPVPQDGNAVKAVSEPKPVVAVKSADVKPADDQPKPAETTKVIRAVQAKEEQPAKDSDVAKPDSKDLKLAEIRAKLEKIHAAKAIQTPEEILADAGNKPADVQPAVVQPAIVQPPVVSAPEVMKPEEKPAETVPVAASAVPVPAMSNADRLAEIKARLAALKNKKAN